jgi:hypothetical protein
VYVAILTTSAGLWSLTPVLCAFAVDGAATKLVEDASLNYVKRRIGKSGICNVLIML